MLFLTVIFLIVALMVATDFIKTRYKTVLFIGLGFFLFIVAAFRPSTIDRDYLSYVRLFDENMRVGEAFIEPSFLLITNFIHRFLFSKVIFLFIFYAGFAVSIKFIAIKQLSHFWFLSALLYVSYSFLLHDLTQIRAGVSVGVVLLCIKPLYERKGIRFLLLAFLAIFFHFSAILLLFLWFLDPTKINTKLYAASIFISYIIFFSSSVILTNVINYLPEGILINKIARYQYDNGAILNVFNSWQMMRCVLCLIFLWKIDIINEKNKYGILLTKIYVLATVAFVLLASNPTFAGRVSDLFSIIDIVLVPCLVYIIKPKMAGIVSVILIAFLYLVLNLYYNKIIF